MACGPRGVIDHRPVVIHNKSHWSYKYLDVFIDESLTRANVEMRVRVRVRLNQQLYFPCLRFHAAHKFMLDFIMHSSRASPNIVSQASVGNRSVQFKTRTVSLDSDRMGKSEKWNNMQSIQEQAALRLANSIVTDQPCLLESAFQLAGWQEVQSPSLLKQMDYLISPSVNKTFKQRHWLTGLGWWFRAYLDGFADMRVCRLII